MRLSVRTGELDRVVTRTNSVNEFSESQSLEGSVSFTKDGHDTPNPHNNHMSPGNMSPHADDSVVAVGEQATEAKAVEDAETKHASDTTAVVTDDNNSPTEHPEVNDKQPLESPKIKEENQVNDVPNKETEHAEISLSVNNLSSSTERKGDKR